MLLTGKKLVRDISGHSNDKLITGKETPCRGAVEGSFQVYKNLFILSVAVF